MKRTRFRSQCQLPLVGSLLLVLSTSAHSVILDDEWGDWYGYTGMAWDLNTNNSASGKLTLSCTGGSFHLDVTAPFSANGLADAMADTTYQECLEHP